MGVGEWQIKKSATPARYRVFGKDEGSSDMAQGMDGFE